MDDMKLNQKIHFSNQINMQGKKLYTVEEYIARINRVIDYIQNNIGEELKLEKLADIANFSAFHFNRIFRAMVGETINHFITRIRIEKAAAYLVGNPKKTISEIAYDCGYSSSATFARAFKERFGMSASDWRERGFIEFSKISKINSNNSKQNGNLSKEIETKDSYFADEIIDFFNIERINAMGKKKFIEGSVKVEKLDTMTVAYLRHIGPYKGNTELFGQLFTKIFQWAGPRGLLKFPETKVISIYHDDPSITDENKLRTDVCITVHPDTKVDGEIGKTQIKAGNYAMASFELATDEYEQAWDFVFGKWMPENGYEPDDGACFEIYKNDPKEHPEHKCLVDICVPVKPM
jgi:AraC family transcriptional regulator